MPSHTRPTRISCRTVIISGDTAAVAEQAPVGLQFALLEKPFLTEVLLEAVKSSRSDVHSDNSA